MEGIYIKDNNNGMLTGFVVHYERGNYAISAFTSCTLRFVLEHAAARGLDGEHLDAPLFYITPGMRSVLELNH